jgi:xanthine/uracil permease
MRFFQTHLDYFGVELCPVSPVRHCLPKHNPAAVPINQIAAMSATTVVLVVSFVTKFNMWRTKSVCWSFVPLNVVIVFSLTLSTVFLNETLVATSTNATTTLPTPTHLKIAPLIICAVYFAPPFLRSLQVKHFVSSFQSQKLRCGFDSIKIILRRVMV